MPDSRPELLIISIAKFPLGHLSATPGVLERIPHAEIQLTLNRHANGDWGSLDDHDRKANERALVDGTRLLSAYDSQEKIRFWIITEWDRSSTTILLPMEY